MKIYRFTDTTGHQRAGNEHASAALRAYRTQQNPERTPAVADRVEISDEARRRYEKFHVHEIEKARAKKIADEYLPFIRRSIAHKSDIASAALRFWEVQSLKRAVILGNYDFNDHDIITRTATALQSFLLD